MASPATSDMSNFYRGSVVSEVLWAISIFFVLIEIIPVLMKLLTPPGPYDVFLRKEMASAEEHHLKLMESVKRVRHAFLKCYEDTNRSAFERVFGAVGREFENLNEGRGRKVFTSVWDQVASRLHATMSQVDREHEHPTPFGVEFPPPSPGLNADKYVPPRSPPSRPRRPVISSRTAMLTGAGALTFASVFGSAWLLLSNNVTIDDTINISIGIGGFIMSVLGFFLTHHRGEGAARFGGINDAI